MKRRRLLAATGTALSIVSAGCNTVGDDLGASDPNSPLDRWLPRPDAIDAERYDFRYATIPTLVEHRDELEDGFVDGYEQQIGIGGPMLRHLGVAIEELDRVVASRKFAVANGDHDLDAARASLESENYSLSAEADDLEVYESDGEKGAVAIGLAESVAIGVGNLVIADDEIMQLGTAPESPGSVVRSIFDADEDDSGRYASEDPYVESVVERIGDGTAGWGFSDERVDETSIDRGEFENEEARGLKFDVEGETTEFTDVIVFGEGDDPPEADVEEWLETENPFRYGTDAPDYSIDVDGNVLLVSGSFDTADMFTLP